MALKGRENALKFCTTPKENNRSQVNLFRCKILIHYRKQEFLETTVFSLGILQNWSKLQVKFATFKQCFIEQMITQFNAESSQLSKTVWNLKIGHTLASHITQKRTLVNLCYSVSDKVLKNQSWATLSVPLPSIHIII